MSEPALAQSSSDSKSKKVHFKGLTELRALAAYAVVFAHIDQHGDDFGLTKLGLEESEIAPHAVTLFFVLSGFLITYLLRQEKTTVGTIDIKKFYVRRVLRIWPVYFLAVACSLVVCFLWPTERPEQFGLATVLYVVMLPNLAAVLSLALPGIIQLWSVGVEEQFYLVWPWLVRKTRSLAKTLLFIFWGFTIFRVALFVVMPTSGLYALAKITRINCMALGGLFSLVYSTGMERWHSLITGKAAQVLAALTLIAPLLTPLQLPLDLEVELYSLAAAVWIYNCAANPHSIIRIESRFLRFLGTVSYGVYVYHMGVLYFLVDWLRGSPAVVVYLTVSGLTTLVAWLSYVGMESPLLRLKNRFAIIGSKA